MRTRSPSTLATTLAALALSCSGAPTEPRGVVVPPAPPATAEESTPPKGPRTYADLGPAHIVPQLGTDGSIVAISPDGLLGVIGAGTTDLTLQVWDLDRKVVVAELVPPSSLVAGTPGFAHGGAFIVLQTWERAAVWDGATGALVGTVEDTGSRAAFDYERAEPEALLYDDRARAVLLRTIRPGPPIFRLAVASEPGQLAISGDRYLVFGDKEIEVYDRTGKLVEKLPGNAARTSDGKPVRGTPWSPPVQTRPPERLGLDYGDCVKGGSKLLCTVYEHYQTNVYLADMGARDPEAARLPRRPAAWFDVPESGAGVSLRCADGQYGTFGFPAGSKELADAERLAELRSSATKGSETVTLVSAKGAILAVSDGHIVVWDVASGKKQTDIANDAILDSAIVVAPSPDGTRIAVGGPGDGTGQVRVFDAATGALVQTLDHGHVIRSVLWKPDGAVLVTTAHSSTGGLYLEDGKASVKLWSARTGKLLRTIKGQYEAAYSENSTLFVTASYGMVEVYDAHTMKKKTTRGGGAYMFASPSPDGKWVLIPKTDTGFAHAGEYEYNGLEVLKAATGSVAQSFAQKPGEMQWSADSTHLLLSTAKSWREDHSTRSFELGLYAIPTGKAEGRWTGPGAVAGARFALGGKLVVASVRGMVRASRASDGASLWIQPVTAGGKCTAVVFDEAGHFDGDDTAVASGLGFRLGDDLRRSAVVHTGPKVDAQRAPGLYAAFLAGAK